MIKNKKGVFGLSSVQSFFAIVLAVALLGYVIVIIMGTLNSTNIIPQSSLTTTVNGEAGNIGPDASPYTLATATVDGFKSPAIVTIVNKTDSALISSGNYTLSAAGVLMNKTARVWSTVEINYTYSYNTGNANNVNSILGNTSSGIATFFGAINPVYGILAVLVIILVLVVLVRVVTGQQGQGSEVSDKVI